MIQNLLERFCALLILFGSLCLWLCATSWVCVAWVPVLLSSPSSGLLPVALPLMLTAIIFVPPILFSLNWFADLLATIGLYAPALWILNALIRIWSLRILPGGLFVPIAQAKVADYLLKSAKLEDALAKYEQALAAYKKSRWRFFSGAGYSLIRYWHMLLKLGRKQEAQELGSFLLLPVLVHTCTSAARIACAAFMPLLFMTLILRIYEDINIKTFQSRPADQRLARLRPTVDLLDSLYGPAGQEYWCKLLATVYQQSHSGHNHADVVFHANASSRVNPEIASTSLSRDDYLVEKWFWQQALKYAAQCSRKEDEVLIQGELEVCEDHLSLVNSASSGLTDTAVIIANNFERLDTEKLPAISLADALERSQKEYGAEHPFTIEKATLLCLSLEDGGKNKQQRRTLTLQTAHDWLIFCKRLENYLGSSQENQLTAEKSNSAQHSRANTLDYAKLGGRQRLCDWANDTGLILSYMLSAEHFNDDALRLARQTFTLNRAGAPPSEKKVSDLLELSRLFKVNDEYAESRATIREAANTAAKLTVGIKAVELGCICQLEEAQLYFEQQDYTASLQLASQAHHTLASCHDTDSAIFADSLESMAQALAMFSDRVSPEAIQDETESLAIREKLFGKHEIRTARTALHLARLLRASVRLADGSYSKDCHPVLQRAAHLLEDSLTVSRNFGSNHALALLYADTCLEYGYCAISLALHEPAQYENARHLLAEACDIHMFLPDLSAARAKVEDLDALASVDAHEGSMAMARTRVLQASGILDNYVTEILPQLSLAEQIAFSHTIEQHMNSLLAVCQNDSTQIDPKLLSLGGVSGLSGLYDPYKHLLRWKGFLLEQLRLRSNLAHNTSDAETNGLIASHEKLSEQIIDKALQTGSFANGQALQTNKEELERQINARTRARFRELAAISLEPDELQRQLSEHEALIDLYEFAPYSDMQHHYAAVVSTRRTLKWLDLGPTSPINAALDQWRRNLQEPLPERKNTRVSAGWRPSISVAKGDEGAQNGWTRLQTLLSEPLLKMLPRSVEHVWLSDESELARLPWDVLLSDTAGNSSIEVCQIDSPRELLELKRNSSPLNPSDKHILLVGGIDYKLRAHALPGTILEIQNIQKQAEKFKLDPIVLSDAKLDAVLPASRQNVLANLSHCSIAHLATHGYFNEQILGREKTSVECIFLAVYN